MTGEISYDLVMDDDMGFVEGTFRLPGESWQVIIVSKSSVPSVEVQHSVWESGVKGLVINVPGETWLNRAVVEGELARAVGVVRWVEVVGPDSMTLR